MTPRTISVVIDQPDPSLTHACASALIGMALTRSGASVADLERGEIALGELIDAIEDATPITGMALHGADDGFCLTLRFDPVTTAPLLDDGSQQVVDAGLDDWCIGDKSATVSLSSARRTSDHE